MYTSGEQPWKDQYQKLANNGTVINHRFSLYNNQINNCVAEGFQVTILRKDPSNKGKFICIVQCTFESTGFAKELYDTAMSHNAPLMPPYSQEVEDGSDTPAGGWLES